MTAGGSGAGGGGADTGGASEAPVPAPPGQPQLGPDETPQIDNGAQPGCTAAPDVCNPALVVTWADIASFRASPPALVTMEPSGWAVRGLPVNLVAKASIEQLAGTLLGFPAEVRFTPAEFVWGYGDGTGGRSTGGGASWAALGLPEFSPTSTSHVYGARGQFAVTVAVQVSAEYRFADRPWRAIEGSIVVGGSTAEVAVMSAATALVAGNCSAQPRAPGC